VLRLGPAAGAEGAEPPPASAWGDDAQADTTAAPASAVDPAEPPAPARALRRLAGQLDRALAPVFSRAVAAIDDAEAAQAADAAGARSPAADGGDNPAATASTQVNNTFNVQVALAGSGSGADRRQIEEQLADWLRASARRQGLLA
jgi:hypothetical protein